MAKEYTYRKAYQRSRVYKLAHRQAKQNKIGIWSPDLCPPVALTGKVITGSRTQLTGSIIQLTGSIVSSGTTAGG